MSSWLMSPAERQLEEQRILQELVAVVEQRDALVALLEEDRQRSHKLYIVSTGSFSIIYNIVCFSHSSKLSNSAFSSPFIKPVLKTINSSLYPFSST